METQRQKPKNSQFFSGIASLLMVDFSVRAVCVMSGGKTLSKSVVKGDLA